MKRYYRILRIWYNGKLPYAKRVHKWMKGRLFRDFQLLTPMYLKNMMEKYGNDAYTKALEEIMSK